MNFTSAISISFRPKAARETSELKVSQLCIIKPHHKLTSDLEDHFVRVAEDVNSKGRDDSDSFIIERLFYFTIR
jgi:hypothetical protein